MSEEAAYELSVMLSELKDNPLDINSATREQLSQIPFLDSGQIEDIQAYVYLHGNMRSLGELQLIGSLDYETRRLLSLLVYAGDGVGRSNMPDRLSDLFRYGRNELILRGDIPMYRRKGFDGRYAGGPVQHSMRYSYGWHDRIRLGVSADKDSGERFMTDRNTPYDFLSGYVQIRDMGCLENIVAGNMKASFGRGLVLNTGFGMGKSMQMNTLDRTQVSFRPHSSVSESGFLTGVGGTVRMGHFSISALASYTGRDATLSDAGLITSFKDDGYHRTSLELSKRHNIRETLYAGHLAWRHNGMDMGATVLTNRFDHGIAWKNDIYNGATPSDRWYWNVGTDYSIRRSRFSFSGETAISDNLCWATLNMLTVKLSGGSRLTALLRHYDSRYNVFHGSSFAEGELRNEDGLYLAMSGRVGRMDVLSYLDIFHFSQPRYGVSESSSGGDVQLQVSYSPRDESDSYLMRYRFKCREQDSKVLESVEMDYTGRLKMQWVHSFSTHLSLQSQLNFTHRFFPDDGFELGESISESLSCNPSKGRLQGSVSFSLFHTDSYAASVSTYEKGLPYSFNFLTMYGYGTRCSSVVRYDLTDGLRISVKFGSTLYFDRDEIGSSQQLIDSRHKEDVSLMLRMKF